MAQTESPPSNYYIGGSTCMTSMYRVGTPHTIIEYIMMHKDWLRMNKIAYYMRKRGHIAVNLLKDIPWQASNSARHVKIC